MIGKSYNLFCPGNRMSPEPLKRFGSPHSIRAEAMTFS